MMYLTVRTSVPLVRLQTMLLWVNHTEQIARSHAAAQSNCCVMGMRIGKVE